MFNEEGSINERIVFISLIYISDTAAYFPRRMLIGDGVTL